MRSYISGTSGRTPLNCTKHTRKKKGKIRLNPDVLLYVSVPRMDFPIDSRCFFDKKVKNFLVTLQKLRH